MNEPYLEDTIFAFTTQAFYLLFSAIFFITPRLSSLFL